MDGDIIRILNQQGMAVTDIIKRRSGEREGVDYEFDINAINDIAIMIVKVKTTLRPEDIRDFIKKLKMTKIWMPEYSDKRVYGAVAFLIEDTGAA